ncbi:hypothetical protein BO70DRAFT_212601 [Aspergillus heteromorphus CBS 117.55]|uniref:Paramyosin n=1 Tax=Aspergillus heteromorphus CBS 117.55 TaxID=1448321 RepID=A0A317WNM9_9EURO|nr:uncharacterized protein BO70DRAFT_212601 [Aspergillus heteromorphus CBS 117.55]PWY86882.1 hypothetical protein BO70DRAFT_212601 [Aspergillus heteromorphus CBS 117.55]
MDPDAATTRDPRLASRSGRPLANRPLSLDTQPLASPTRFKPDILQQPGSLSPVDTQNAPEQFLRGISDLVQAAVSYASSQSERERLQKKRDTTETLLKKAKAHSSFPSTAAFFSQSQRDEEVDLVRVDDALRRHAANYRSLENALKTKIGSIMQMDTLKSGDKMTQLQQDVQVAKQGLASAKIDTEKLRDYNITLENKMQQLQQGTDNKMKQLHDKMAPLERTSTNHASTLNTHAKLVRENSERVANMRSELETVSISQKESGSASFKRHLDELESRNSDLEHKMDLLQKSQREFSESFYKINQLMDTQKAENVRVLEAFNTRLDSVEQRSPLFVPTAEDTTPGSSVMLKKLEPRLQKLETGQYKPDPMLGSRLQELKGQFDKMKEIQEMKDDLHCTQLEELKSSMETGSNELDTIKDTLERITQEMSVLSEKQGREIISGSHGQQILALSNWLRNTQHLFESLRVGLHSLEVRYNNLSTEAMARNMLAAMQEMHPTAHLADQVSALRGRFEKEFVPWKATAEHLQHAQRDQIEQMQKDMASRQEESNRWKKEHTNLSQSLAPVLKRLTARSQDCWLTLDDLRPMQTEVSSLATRLNEHTTRIDSFLVAKKKEDDSLCRSLRSEREGLKRKIEALADEQKGLVKLASDVNKDDMPSQVKALSVELKGLAKLFSAFEEDNLHAQVKELTKGQDHLAKRISRIPNDNLNVQVKALYEKQESFAQKLAEVQDLPGMVRSLDEKQKALAQSSPAAQMISMRDGIKALTSEQANMSKRLIDAQAIYQNGLKALKSCPDELRSMLDRLCQVEDTYRDLREKLSLIEGPLSSYTTLSERFDNLVQTLEFSEIAPQAEAPPTLRETTKPLKLKETPQDAEVARISSIAESSPVRALQQRKKKRPRPSNLSDEDRSSLSRPESPRSTITASPYGRDTTPNTDRKKVKKKKKRRLTEEPITITD